MSDANLLLEPEQLDQDRASVEGEAYRHLFRARRLGVDDSLRVFDGSGRARRAIVESVDRHRAILRLGEVAPSREPEMAVGIAAATLRPERASWLVEKVTEVGVSTISFFNCRRAPRTPGAGQLERWNRMARAAAEQCGRALVPPVELLPDFDRLLERVGERRAVVLDPGAPALASMVGDHRELLVIGPEGGLERSEVAALCEAGARAAGLGERILRAETAAVVAAATVLLG